MLRLKERKTERERKNEQKKERYEKNEICKMQDLNLEWFILELVTNDRRHCF